MKPSDAPAGLSLLPGDLQGGRQNKGGTAPRMCSLGQVLANTATLVVRCLQTNAKEINLPSNCWPGAAIQL